VRRQAAAADVTTAGADASADATAAAEATVTLRFACFDDAPDLLRLAQLDSAEPLIEPILVCEVSRRMVAALSLADRRAIADPFVPSAGVVELLRARARQLTAPDRGWRGLRLGGGRRARRLRPYPS
jgi:hypothetical protein